MPKVPKMPKMPKIETDRTILVKLVLQIQKHPSGVILLKRQNAFILGTLGILENFGIT